jgi:DNA-binding transcriptional MerR regulator
VPEARSRKDPVRSQNGADAAASANQLTIEQLAAESGMSVRNIRSHQARGLLAPPEVRHRVGYYGAEHVAQLRLIRDLQDEGFNLNGIKKLLEDSKGTAERLLRFKETLTAPLSDETPETLTAGDLARRFPLPPGDAEYVLGRAIKLRVLRPIGEGVFEAPSPALLGVAEELGRHGVSLKGALDILEEAEKHLDSVSRAFVRLFLREVWRPFQEADMPAEQWPDMEEAIERLRPIASEALLAIFQHRLGTQIESAFGEITRRLTQGKK